MSYPLPVTAMISGAEKSSSAIYFMREGLNFCISYPGITSLVLAEFNRIAATNLLNNLFDSLDRYTPCFVTIFQSKKGSVGRTLSKFVQQINSEKPDVTAMRTLVLRGLPVLLGDDPSTFYITCLPSNSDEAWAHVSVGLLTVIDEDLPTSPNPLHLDPVSIAIIAEGGIVMDDLQNLPQALCLFFGLSYTLHLEYPKTMKNTFNFIQRVMVGLGENKPTKESPVELKCKVCLLSCDPWCK